MSGEFSLALSAINVPTFTSTATLRLGYSRPSALSFPLQSPPHRRWTPAEEDREEEEEEEKWSPGSWYITAMSEQRERGEMRQRGGGNVGRVREERERGMEGLICRLKEGFEGGNTLRNTLNQTVNKKWKCYSRLCSKAEQETK